MGNFNYKLELGNSDSFYVKRPSLLNEKVEEAKIIDEYFGKKSISKYIIRSFILEKKLSVEDRINYIKGLVHADICIYTYYSLIASGKNIGSFSRYKKNFIKSISDSKNDDEFKMIKRAMKLWFHIETITPRADYFYKYIISDEDVEEIQKLL